MQFAIVSAVMMIFTRSFSQSDRVGVSEPSMFHRLPYRTVEQKHRCIHRGTYCLVEIGLAYRAGEQQALVIRWAINAPQITLSVDR